MADDKRAFCFISEVVQFFEWPHRAIRPRWYGCGDVFGCGLVLSPDDKLAIFFTTNGTLMGQSSNGELRSIKRGIYNTLFVILLYHLVTGRWDETFNVSEQIFGMKIT
jgi:hypothetical protein